MAARKRGAPSGGDRCPEKAGFRLTARDSTLLAEIFLSNCLTSAQACSLGFFGSRSRANRRLKLLADNGYLRRKAVATCPTSAEAAYFIGPEAVGPVALATGMEAGEIRRHGSRPLGRTFLEHARMAAETRLAIARTAPPCSVRRFYTEPECRYEYSVADGHGQRRNHVLKPDLAFEFENGGLGLLAFVECDRGTVSPAKWESSVAAYRRCARLGLIGQAYGVDRCAVLVVTEGGRSRIARLSRASEGPEEPPFYFITSAELFGTEEGEAPAWADSAGTAFLTMGEIVTRHGAVPR